MIFLPQKQQFYYTKIVYYNTSLFDSQENKPVYFLELGETFIDLKLI